MRLTTIQIEAIKRNFKHHFSNGDIYLFGSRVDNQASGGDIDLYIVTEDRENIAYKKIQFLVDLKREIGEQKIDVVLNYDENRTIEVIAKSKGIKL